MKYWVVDANIAVGTALELSETLERFWERVNREEIAPCAPRLWLSETTSAIRFLLSRGEIKPEEADEALRTIHGLGVEIVNEDEELSLRALEWADKLRQSKAYDAFYLATAEKLAADFWTMDERLANRCRKDLRLHWVHWIGELR